VRGGRLLGVIAGVSASPPPVSGTLTADQATAAEQAVAAFWSALGSNWYVDIARSAGFFFGGSC
jgi:hypothetical protein